MPPRTRKTAHKSTGPIGVPRHQLAPRHEESSNGSNNPIGDIEAQVEQLWTELHHRNRVWVEDGQRINELRANVRHLQDELAEWDLATVGGLLHRWRSFKKKHLRKISIEANIARRHAPKPPSRELRHSDMPWDKGLHRLKEEKTNRPMVICVMIVTSCRGHKCNFDRAVSRAYK
jgi:hypothetical protein